MGDAMGRCRDGADTRSTTADETTWPYLTWHRSLVGHAMYCRIHSYTKGYDTINRWISFSYIYNRPYDPINLYAEEEREPGTFNTSTVNIQNLVPGCKP